MTEGKTFEDQILSNRNDLKNKKLLVKELTEACNSTKRDIDSVKAKLDEKAEEKKRQMRDDLAGMEDDDGMGGGEGGQMQQEIIDEEELSYFQRMKELKRSYRESFDQLKNLRGEVFYIQQSIDTLKQQLVGAYEDWYQATFDLEEDGSYNNTKSQKALQQSTKQVPTLQQVFRDDGVGADEDQGGLRRSDGEDGGVDNDALAFIRAKRKVNDLHKAKKIEKKGGVV